MKEIKEEKLKKSKQKIEGNQSKKVKEIKAEK